MLKLLVGYKGVRAPRGGGERSVDKRPFGGEGVMGEARCRREEFRIGRVRGRRIRRRKGTKGWVRGETGTGREEGRGRERRDRRTLDLDWGRFERNDSNGTMGVGMLEAGTIVAAGRR
jgi:hypothetical protein